ncbi:hypothetical protein MBLNU459_g2243t2 [Dothideomycetes sp. NU459]
MATITSSQLWSSQPEIPSSQSVDSQPLRKVKAKRTAKPIPFELGEHCIVYIEEELSGTDNTAHEHALPAFIPSPNLLALAATLVVHPSMTNRASSPDKVQAADEALHLLEHVNALVGPTNADFSTAFQFTHSSTNRPVGRRSSAYVDESRDDEDGKIHSSLANEGAIWTKAEDFWQVVGWAFNCSVRHPKRWDRWKVWLQFMLDVLEDDLEEKIVASTAKLDEDEAKRTASDAILSDSLFSRYLQLRDEGRTGKRRTMRAILANGSKKDLGEFGEIWKNETKERTPPKDVHVSKWKAPKLDDDDFGDYMDVEDEDEDEEASDEFGSTRQSRSSTRHSTRKREQVNQETLESEDEAAPLDENISGDYGGFESIVLRQRFMTLLTRTCTVQHILFTSTEDLFDLFTEFLRPLPLSIFVQFVLPTTPYLEPHAQARLIQILFRPLISSEAPVYNAYSMTQAEFEKHFLPFPASHYNYVDNARLSCMIESLLRMLLRHADLRITDSLVAKLEEGIEARESKAKSSAKKKKKIGEREAEERYAADVMKMSAARMRMLIAAAKDAE